MRKMKIAATMLGAGMLLAGCSNGTVAGLSLQKTDGFEHRDQVVVLTEVLQGDEASGFKNIAGTARFFEDQTEFTNSSISFGAEKRYTTFNYDESASLDGHTYSVTVYAASPEQTAHCAIKSEGIFEPVESAEVTGKGSATCVLKLGK